MLYLEESTACLTWMGLWRPKISSKFNSALYCLYSAVILSSLFTFLLSQLLDLFLVVDETTEFINNIYSMLFTATVCLKMVNIVRCRAEFLRIISTYRTRPFAAADSAEVFVENRIHEIIRPINVGGACATALAATFYIVYKVLESRPPGILPLRAWVPFDNLNPIFYWSSTCYQFIIMAVGVTINFAYNVFYIGVMMLVVVSVRRFKHRLRLTINALVLINTHIDCIGSSELVKMENKIFHSCVEHHVALLRLSKDVNQIFSSIIIVQYLFSSIILCVTAYVTSKLSPFTVACMANIGYFLCAFIQILVLTLSTYQITLEFNGITEVIYRTNWLKLSKRSQKSVMLIMMSASKSHVFTCYQFLKFDIHSLSKVFISLVINIFFDTNKVKKLN